MSNNGYNSPYPEGPLPHLTRTPGEARLRGAEKLRDLMTALEHHVDASRQMGFDTKLKVDLDPTGVSGNILISIRAQGGPFVEFQCRVDGDTLRFNNSWKGTKSEFKHLFRRWRYHARSTIAPDGSTVSFAP